MEFNWSPDSSMTGGPEAFVVGSAGGVTVVLSLRPQPDPKRPAAHIRTVIAEAAAALARGGNFILPDCTAYGAVVCQAGYNFLSGKTRHALMPLIRPGCRASARPHGAVRWRCSG